MVEKKVEEVWNVASRDSNEKGKIEVVGPGHDSIDGDEGVETRADREPVRPVEPVKRKEGINIAPEENVISFKNAANKKREPVADVKPDGPKVIKLENRRRKGEFKGEELPASVARVIETAFGEFNEGKEDKEKEEAVIRGVFELLKLGEKKDISGETYEWILKTCFSRSVRNEAGVEGSSSIPSTANGLSDEEKEFANEVLDQIKFIDNGKKAA